MECRRNLDEKKDTEDSAMAFPGSENDKEVNWLALPDHLMSLVADKLIATKDYIRFGAVCPSWRAIYTGNRDHILREPLVLMLPTELDQDKTQTRSLYSFSQKKLYTFPIRVPEHKFCAGSSHGWLVIVSENYDIRLVNPFLTPSNEIVLPRLPAVEPIMDDYPYEVNYVEKIVLSGDPISCPNYIAMAIHYKKSRLSFFRPRDRLWTPLDRRFEPIQDVIYCEDKFYVVSHNGEVYACNVNGPMPIVSKVTPKLKGEWDSERHYLVKSSGDLLLVGRDLDYESEQYITDRFTVLKLNPDVPEWIELKSIGEQMLFLGNSYSMIVSAADMPGCKPNSIYFTDDNLEGYFYPIDVGPHDLGVFSLEDESIEPHYPVESDMIYPAPLIIKPTPKHMWF